MSGESPGGGSANGQYAMAGGSFLSAYLDRQAKAAEEKKKREQDIIQAYQNNQGNALDSALNSYGKGLLGGY